MQPTVSSAEGSVDDSANATHAKRRIVELDGETLTPELLVELGEGKYDIDLSTDAWKRCHIGAGRLICVSRAVGALECVVCCAEISRNRHYFSFRNFRAIAALIRNWRIFQLKNSPSR
jgi:hypothetical protein